MYSNQFWEEVDQRVRENRSIVQGGLPRSWAIVMEWVGLRFWQVGASLSFVASIWLFAVYYSSVMRIVRWMVWR